MTIKKFTKKELLQLYRQVKKDLKLHDGPIKREHFVEYANISKHRITEVFGSYSNFIEEAEKNYQEKLPQSYRALLSEKSKKFDPEATKESCIEDLRAVQQDHPTMFITRNYYREHGGYSDSTWNRFFGTFQEFKRQAGLELSRQQHHAERGIARHASVEHYRKYFKTEVMPYYKKYEKKGTPTKIKTIMVASDIHDEECDEFSLEVFIDTCRRKQPDVIVLNGDIFDLYEFSKYSQDPRLIKIKERFDFVHSRIFKPLRDACPDAQIDFILGNHEIRLIKLLADASPNLRVLLSDVVGLTFAKVFGVDEYQINIVTKIDFGVFTKKDLKNEMKQNYQVYFGCYAICHEPDERIRRSMCGTNGHHHSASMVSDGNLNFGSITWVQTPCLHVRDAEYLKTLSGWNMGFLEVIVNVESSQVIQKIHQTHEDWTVIDGVFYARKEQG